MCVVVASRRWVRVVTSVVAAGSLLAVDAAAADASAAGVRQAVAPAASPAKAKVTEAPDLVSARVAARAQGVRVEAVSERTEFVTTFVNPDGTLTTEAATTRVRFKDPAGSKAGADAWGWRRVDLTLAAAGGRVAPVASPLKLDLSAGGAAGSEFVSVDHGVDARAGKDAPGRSVSWSLAEV
jgi:hypothetical protein